jgi:F-box/leucine-rich repeat protein 4
MEHAFKKNKCIEGSPKINLFVLDIVDFSSQYGKEFSKSYTIANLRSAPNHFPRYGDFLESCVLRTYGPWWLDSPSNINVPISAKPLFISQDFIGFYQKILLSDI